MPQSPRTRSSSGIYHVVLRSVNQQQIFQEDADYQKFLFLLSDCKERYHIDLYAYCLMSNHIHLLIHDSAWSLPVFFNSLQSRFSRWYNEKYERTGHLFQGRYRSKPVDRETYLLRVIHYIHENPVRSKMARSAIEYPWSSSRCYYGSANKLIDLDQVIQLSGSLSHIQKHFFQTPLTDNELQHYALPKYLPPPSKDHALRLFHQITQCASPSDFQHLPRVRQKELVKDLAKHKIPQTRIASLCGISRMTVYRYLQ